MNKERRIRLEKKIVRIMIKLYCKYNHKNKNLLCNDCKKLLQYSFSKIRNCPFIDNKPICKDCKIHCYNSFFRQKIKQVMKFSGPKMFIYHPFLSLIYLINCLKTKIKKKD